MTIKGIEHLLPNSKSLGDTYDCTALPLSSPAFVFFKEPCKLKTRVSE